MCSLIKNRGSVKKKGSPKDLSQLIMFTTACVCVCVCSHLAIETQVKVIGRNLEHQSSRFCPLSDGGLVNGRSEKRDVVIDI